MALKPVAARIERTINEWGPVQTRYPLASQAVLKQVDRWIDAHKKDLVDLTCRLVSINTTVPPGLNYPKISQVLASELKELGVMQDEIQGLLCVTGASSP